MKVGGTSKTKVTPPAIFSNIPWPAQIPSALTIMVGGNLKTRPGVERSTSADPALLTRVKANSWHLPISWGKSRKRKIMKPWEYLSYAYYLGLYLCQKSRIKWLFKNQLQKLEGQVAKFSECCQLSEWPSSLLQGKIYCTLIFVLAGRVTFTKS